MKLSSKTYPEVLKFIKSKDIKLYAFLREGKPYKFQKGILYIGFPENKSFHKNILEKNKNKLTKLMNECVTDDFKISLTFYMGVPTLEKIAKMFDGEIIEVDESVLKEMESENNENKKKD